MCSEYPTQRELVDAERELITAVKDITAVSHVNQRVPESAYIHRAEEAVTNYREVVERRARHASLSS